MEKNVMNSKTFKPANFIQAIPYFISGITAVWLSVVILTGFFRNGLSENSLHSDNNTAYGSKSYISYQDIDNVNEQEPEPTFPDYMSYENTMQSFKQNLSLPLSEFFQTDVFGGRTNPITNAWEGHNGVDLDGGWKSNISAIAEGQVCAVNTNTSTLGNWIMIRHKRGNEIMYSLYGHLHSVSVAVNDRVERGQVIGTQGGDPKLDDNPGQSTGSHLHLEIRLMEATDTSIDPAFLLPLQQGGVSE